MGASRDLVYLSLGSNMGDRGANLLEAVDALGRLDRTAVLQQSAWYETAPYGYEDQPDFLNAAIEIETAFEPLELLKMVKAIESRLGREDGPRWGPRIIDIDIVLWGARQVSLENLTIPHAEFRRRAFVLVPLAEIAAQEIDPISGLTIEVLLDAVDDKDLVRRMEINS